LRMCPAAYRWGFMDVLIPSPPLPADPVKAETAARGVVGSGVSKPADKWGEDTLRAGYRIIPDSLIRHFRHMGMSVTDLAVVLNLVIHWWGADRGPFPEVATIARRLDVDPRTVQRSLNRLRAKQLIRWTRSDINGNSRRQYDLKPLAEALRGWSLHDLEFRRAMTTSSPTGGEGGGFQPHLPPDWLDGR